VVEGDEAARLETTDEQGELEMTTTARRVRVHGTVQGVSFRDSCAGEAQRRKVDGWVRNEDDGTVLVHLEGEADSVAAMVAWCRSGPDGADVRRIDDDAIEPEGCDGFSVV
jgi:acylphosphatase